MLRIFKRLCDERVCYLLVFSSENKVIFLTIALHYYFSERVGPSCDGVCAFEAVHSVPFSRPPPPYQKPFQQNLQNQSKTPQTFIITEEGESVANSNLTKVVNSSEKSAETLGLEKQDLELAEFSSECDKKDSACKNNDIAELDSFEGQSSGRKKSLEMIHNQPCVGSKEDVVRTKLNILIYFIRF